MSLNVNDVCLLAVEDYNLYEEEASDHAFARYGPGVVADILLITQRLLYSCSYERIFKYKNK